jgi:hypothetical protein
VHLMLIYRVYLLNATCSYIIKNKKSVCGYYNFLSQNVLKAITFKYYQTIIGTDKFSQHIVFHIQKDSK